MSVLSKLGVEKKVLIELPKLMRIIGNDNGYAAKLVKIENYDDWSLREKIALAYSIGKYSGAEAMIQEPLRNERALRSILHTSTLSDNEIEMMVEEAFAERKE